MAWILAAFLQAQEGGKAPFDRWESCFGGRGTPVDTEPQGMGAAVRQGSKPDRPSSLLHLQKHCLGTPQCVSVPTFSARWRCQSFMVLTPIKKEKGNGSSI
ncbi:UNVERIFIED_CONTAM: hypothetical protein K2H54_075549 [Gekko kuhli]